MSPPENPAHAVFTGQVWVGSQNGAHVMMLRSQPRRGLQSTFFVQASPTSPVPAVKQVKPLTPVTSVLLRHLRPVAHVDA
jgi:hypothetical protein